MKDYTIQHPETLIFPVMTSRPSVSTNYTVDIPLGCYYLQLIIHVVGLTPDSCSWSVYPYLNAAQTVVGAPFSLRALQDSESEDYTSAEDGDTTNSVEIGLSVELGKRMPIPLPFGVRLAYAIGDSTGATSLAATIVAVRDA